MKTAHLLFGLTLGVISGFLSGSSGGLLKKIKVWQLENIWLAYSVWALLLLPGILAWVTIPRLLAIISSVPWTTLALVFLCGVGWGTATIGYALGIRDIGLALTSVIVIGLGNAVGTLLPLILYHPESLSQPVGFLIMGGVALTVCGIVGCSTASLLTERQLMPDSAPRGRTPGALTRGIIICMLSGLLSILFNLGLIVGKPLTQQAVLSGVAPSQAANATWFVLLGGGCSVLMIYCLRHMIRNKSYRLFKRRETAMNWIYLLLMGIVWLSGVILYGMSVTSLGRLGPSLGWPIFQCIQIAAANLWGAVTGEWRGATRRVNLIRFGGLLIIFCGIGLFGWAGAFQS